MKNKTNAYHKSHSIYQQDVLGGLFAYKKIITKILRAGPYALFVLFDFKLFLMSQLSLSLGHVGMGPPGLNQY